MNLRTILGLSALACGNAVLAQAQSPAEALQKHLGIPDTIAYVSDASGVSLTRLPDYILIQDLHEHPQAQGAIASVLLYGRRAWNIHTVFVEGASGRVPSHFLRQEASGAERAACMDTDKSLSLYGIEEWPLYAENLRAYEQTKRLEKNALQDLQTIRRLGRALGGSRADDARWQRLESLVRLEWLPSDAQAYEHDPMTRIQSPALAQAVEQAQTFYRLADERSGVFLEKAQNHSVTGSRVLVVGGFHTTAMARELRRKGRSYVVLTPRITQAQDEGRYAQRMSESLSALKISEAFR